MAATTENKSNLNESLIDTVMLALANLYDQMGQSASALGIYTSIIKRNPACVRALYSRGLILLMNSQDDQAMRDLHKAVATGANKDKLALRSRALGYAVSCNYEAAAKDMLKALESNDWDALTCLLAYLILKKAYMDEQANQILNDALDKNIKSHDWPYPILQQLRGDIDLMTLMNQANSIKGRLLETRAYLGFAKALGNNEQEGKPDLQFVASSKQGSTLIRLIAIRQMDILEHGAEAALQRRAQKADKTANMDWMS